ncbi:flagellin [Sodalis sp. RH21]|uniref:flagellin N-terminal helical domain-containing protein n=1 Tax=unclassified Sodalis (in: enterobacteria) TaxID=2636512 RepID=UPI0039B4176D
MAQVINTNSISLLAQNNLNKSQSSLSTAIERLSSGLRINSAKDDAAGQAISNRFTSNINGLNQASRNANDGISLAQTTEGALDEINSNLQAIRTLTVQAQTGTNSSSDLQSIQDEVTQRLDEVDRISKQTDFNGVKVLSSDKNLSIQVGSNDGETIDIALKKIDAKSLGLGTFNVNGTQGQTTAVTKAGTSMTPTAVVLNTDKFGADTIKSVALKDSDGNDVTAALSKDSSGKYVATTDKGYYAVDEASLSIDASGKLSGTVGSFTTAEKTTTTGTTTTPKVLTTKTSADLHSGAAGTTTTKFTDSAGVALTNSDNITVQQDADGNYYAIDTTNGTYATMATADATSGDYDDTNTGDETLTLKVSGTFTAGVPSDTTTGVPTTSYVTTASAFEGTDVTKVNLADSNSISSTKFATSNLVSDEKGNYYVQDADGTSYAAKVSIDTNGVLTATADSTKAIKNTGTDNALATLDSALSTVDTMRSNLGAVQNRFDSTINNLASTTSNLSEAQSRIQDADYATEVSNMSKAQILQQAGTSVLSQANQVPQTVLKLLQ